MDYIRTCVIGQCQLLNAGAHVNRPQVLRVHVVSYHHLLIGFHISRLLSFNSLFLLFRYQRCPFQFLFCPKEILICPYKIPN